MSEHMNLEDQVIQQVRHAIKDAITTKLGSYNSPLDKLIAVAIDNHATRLSALIDDAVLNTTSDASFKEEIRIAYREKLAKVLVQRMGGEMERQINELKSSPSTRARITLAIEDIVRNP